MSYSHRSNLQRAPSDQPSSSRQYYAPSIGYETLPPQRVSLYDVQANAGLPFARPASQTPNQHPSMSRLHAAKHRHADHNSAQVVPEQAGNLSHALASQLLSQTYQAHYGSHTGCAKLSYPDLATYAPLHAAHHQLPHHQTAATDSHAQCLLLRRMQASQQQCQHQLSEPAMACEESWPWDDNLLDSPGSDSFESASTTYDPPSDESIPESYTSSTASASALIPAHAPHLTGNYQDVRFQSQGPFRPFQYCGQTSGMSAVSKPPLAPAACQLVKASEHRRVPRPRFRASNPPRVSNKAKRSLLADLEAVSDDIDLHFNVDYAFRSSCLIKAISMPRTRHMFDGYAEGFPGDARQAETKQGLHQCSVQLADMDWQEEESAQITLEMGGMSIERRFNHNRPVAPRCKPAEPGTESANTDSMFAWLSKLLPGL